MREKLIELIKAGMHFGIYYDTVVRSSELGEIADHFIANGVTIQKWLPVSERLPENFGEYIVAVKDETGEVYADYADYDPYQQQWKTGLYLGVRDKITHWMPLPSTEGLK